MTFLRNKQCRGRLEIAVRSVASPCADEAVENEDNYLLINGEGRVETLLNQKRYVGRLADWPANHMRLAVLDGVGGHGQGRLIAERIVAELIALPAFTSQEALNKALDAVHRRIQIEFSGSALSPPGATLLLLEVPPSGPAFLFHVGDSRMFALHQEGMELLTVDHSPPTAFALQGLLGEDEWRRQVLGENRSAISQAFGMGSLLNGSGGLQPGLIELISERMPGFLTHLPDRRCLMLEPGKSFLMATDGLWTYQDPLRFLGGLTALMSESQDDLNEFADSIVHEHCQASRNERRDDNTTFILFRAQA
ncbi:MAG: PP2C family protein-serine/threonine phosphatase [Desulfobulbia bacterium]